MKSYVLLVASLAMSTAAIAAKLDAKHVSGYTLDVVPADQAGDGKVIGSCEGGAKKIVYTKK